jgi:hypothetical protein
MNMYETTCRVLKKLLNKGANYNYLKEFDFIMILHLMKENIGVTYVLC